MSAAAPLPPGGPPGGSPYHFKPINTSGKRGITRRRSPNRSPSPLTVQAAQATQAAHYQALVNQVEAPTSAQIIQAAWRGKGKTRRKRIKRRKSGSGLFPRKKKIMIDGMSEGTIKRLSNSTTTFAAIIKARTKTREGMKALRAYREALGNKKLLEKDLRALPTFLKWQKKQEIPVVDAAPVVDGVHIVDKKVPPLPTGGRRTRRKTKRKRKRRKTRRKNRRKTRRKTKRKRRRKRTRRKKQRGGSVELENWRPTASYGFNDAGEFSKKIPTDSYPNFTTNPSSY